MTKKKKKQPNTHEGKEFVKELNKLLKKAVEYDPRIDPKDPYYKEESVKVNE